MSLCICGHEEYDHTLIDRIYVDSSNPNMGSWKAYRCDGNRGVTAIKKRPIPCDCQTLQLSPFQVAKEAEDGI